MDLPMLEPQEPPERADAARNRQRILACASELFDTHGATAVCMEDIAKAAGVGKGTLYRRYPDKSTLASALLDAHERELQEMILTGEPPLGPGAPPAERLAAFYSASIDLLERHADLALAAHSGSSRYRAGAYIAWRAHVRVLLRQAEIEDSGDTLADVLLAPLAGDFYQAMHERGTPTTQIKHALTRLSHSVFG